MSKKGCGSLYTRSHSLLVNNFNFCFYSMEGFISTSAHSIATVSNIIGQLLIVQRLHAQYISNIRTYIHVRTSWSYFQINVVRNRLK